MTEGGRARLARRQAELLSALLGQNSDLPGFDTRQVRTAAASLQGKRVRAIARAWPRLAAALGPDFGCQVGLHVDEHPSPPAGGALSDGQAFARDLAARACLPWEGRLELLAVELRWRWGVDGRRRQRRFGAGFAVGRPFRLAVAARAPGVGERWLRLPR